MTHPGFVSWCMMYDHCTRSGAHFISNFFHHNSNLMEISFYFHPNTNEVIPLKFCTWHNSCAVVACAKFCYDINISNWVTAKLNFHQIWIVMENFLVKWDPGSCFKMKTVFPWISISIIKIRRAWDCLIFIKGIHILIKQLLYTEMVPRCKSTIIN